MATQAMSIDFFAEDPPQDDDDDQDHDRDQQGNAADEDSIDNLWGRLVCVASEGRSKDDIELRGPSLTLGRSRSECNVLFKTRFLSGKHCVLTRKRTHGITGDWCTFVEDLSSNGTWVNGRRIAKNQPFLITNADELELVRPTPDCEGIKFIYQAADRVRIMAKAAHERELAATAALASRGSSGSSSSGSSSSSNSTNMPDQSDGSGIMMPPPKGVPAKLAGTSKPAQLAAHGSKGDPYVLYDVGRTLGTGNFASVKLATQLSSGKDFAFKIINKKQYARQATNYREGAMMDEVRILQSVKHPNIIGIEEVFDTPTELCIVLELVTGGELFDYIRDHGSVDEVRARALIRQMFEAVTYLHANHIVHRDLKPENILFKDKTYSSLKISDFGLSKSVNQGSVMGTMCGTPQYLAPEVMQPALIDIYRRRTAQPSAESSSASSKGPAASSPLKTGYFPNVDCWSLGAILFVMLAGCAPLDDSAPLPFFDGQEEEEDFCPVEFNRPSKDWWDTISAAAKDLIVRLMCVNPFTRISAADALKHPFFTGESMDRLNEQKLQARALREKLKAQRTAEQIAAEEKRFEAAVSQKLEEQKKRKRAQMETESFVADKRKAKKQRRPECQYGAGCFRENPQHYKQFAHPHFWDETNVSSDDDEEAYSDDSE